MTEAACYSRPDDASLRIETIPFARVPHQSRLFLDYLRDPATLQRFYHSAVRFHHELAGRVPEVLSNYHVDRGALCDALEDANRLWGAGEETLGNIALLREAETVAVVSGQQIGLCTGPLYTIYKALTAVKLAGCLAGRGTKVVPIFWMATEDHDWDEVATAEVIACDGRLASTTVAPSTHREGTSVGTVTLDASIVETIQRLLDVLPETEFTPDVRTLIESAYREGASYTDAFAQVLTALTKRFGLILLDPLDVRLKRLVAPIYSEAAARAPELAAAIDARSRELEAAGYHAQVFTSADAFPLFLQSDGTRRALTRSSSSDGENKYQTKGARDEKSYTVYELSAWAARAPEDFSPNVTFRAVVQDYLLPTLTYIGGAAEIAYFAQVNEIYRLLNRPVTPIMPRASLTVIERRTSRTLERYDLKLTDFFDGFDHLIAHVVEQHLGAESARTFDQTDETVKRALDDLREQLKQLDPTLGEALENGRRKINYQLNGLRTRFHRAQMARDRAAHRQLERAFTALYPEKNLQERRINVTSLLARRGLYAIEWLYDAIDLGSHDHQIVYL